METAQNGESPDFSDKIPKTLSKKTYEKPIKIPNAKLIPIPPRRFTEETATPMKVRINAVKTNAHRL